MTLLNANDGDSSDHSYLEVVEAILKISNQPQKDLEQLFRRVAFSIIFHNYDNHLRNHGMIYKNNKWQLSPCFDINISPYLGRHSLTIDGNEATLDNLIENSSFFRLNKEKANEIINQIRQVAKFCLIDQCYELSVTKELTKVFQKTIIAD